MKTINPLNRLFITMMMVCSFLFVSQVTAQSKANNQYKTPEERAKMLTDKMKQELTLTDAQYQPVYNINLKYANKNEELMKTSGSDKQAKVSEWKSLQENKDVELKAVLTDQQYTKYQQEKQEMKSKAEKAYKNHK